MAAKFISFAVLAISLFSTTAIAQTDMERELRSKFEAELKQINENFHGVLGAQFVDLTDGQKISINADAVLPTASTIKVAILLELFRQADQKPDLLKQQRPFDAYVAGDIGATMSPARLCRVVLFGLRFSGKNKKSETT